MPTYTVTTPTKIGGQPCAVGDAVDLDIEDAAPYVDAGVLDGPTTAAAGAPPVSRARAPAAARPKKK